MDLMSVEILLKICEDYLEIFDLKKLALVNRRLSIICRDVIFSDPVFKNHRSLSEISHLPMKILKTSNISRDSFIGRNFMRKDYNAIIFPNTVHTVIMDSRRRFISPDVIRNHPHIIFIGSVDYLQDPPYHFSNYLLPNFRLYTSNSCLISIQRIQLYHKFRFKFLVFSHFESMFQTVSQEERLDVLAGLKIDRIILNFCTPELKPQFLEKLENLNIVYISSDIFGNYYPLEIRYKLPALEIIHFSYNCTFDYNEFKKIDYIYVTISRLRLCCCHPARKYNPTRSYLVKRAGVGLGRARRSFSLFLKPIKHQLYRLERGSYSFRCDHCRSSKVGYRAGR